MKIKRYFAPTMREAIRRVRQEQGADAVILSNKAVAGGVEIVAAVDYDESLLEPVAGAPAESAAPVAVHPATVAPLGVAAEAPAAPRAAVRPAAGVEWSQEPTLVAMRKEIKSLRGMLEGQLSGLAWGEMKRSQPAQASLLQRLMGMGLSVPLCREIAAAVPAADPDHAWRQGLAALAGRVEVTNDDIISNGGVVALVGPTGVGKTTTVAKLAARFALRHGRRHVALVTTDSYRIGAHEQLRTYGRLLGVPVHVASDAAELRAALDELKDKKLVLIDTAGMSQRDIRLSEQIATLKGGAPSVKSYLVLSATTQGRALEEAVRGFRKVELSGCVITKLDEAASLGGALSVAVVNKLPIAYVGDGQRVPEDMHPARAANLVNRGVMMMQENAQVMEEESLAMAFGGMGNHV